MYSSYIRELRRSYPHCLVLESRTSGIWPQRLQSYLRHKVIRTILRAHTAIVLARPQVLYERRTWRLTPPRRLERRLASQERREVRSRVCPWSEGDRRCMYLRNECVEKKEDETAELA